MTKETGLALVQQGNLPALDTPQKLAVQLQEMSKQAIVLSPVSQVTTIAAMHQVALSVVSIDPDTLKGGDCYKDARFCKGDHVAPGKVALSKICRAAGVQVICNERVDDRSNPYYCHIKMTLGMREYTGEWTQHICSKEVDLSDGAPETFKKDKSIRTDLAEMRKHMLSNCETKCLQRGLRQMLGLQQTYSAAQLKAKPFLIPKLVQNLDPNDPDQKAALIAQATGAQGAIFGSKGQPASVTDGTATPDAGTTVVEAEAAPEPAPEPDDMSEFSDPPDPPAKAEGDGTIHVCECPCGHQEEVTPEVADKTQELVNGIRCRVCFPGKAFDFAMHKDLPGGKLGLTTEKHGAITVEMVKAWIG